MTNTEMPNLFVIGAAKSGTSSLHGYLDLHPDIAMSRVKEPGFFLPEGEPRRSVSIRDKRRYLRLFKKGCKIRGESTVAYSNFPHFPGVPRAIAEEVSDARFIYLVRDPVERVPAMIRQGVAVGAIEPDDPTVGVTVADWIGDLAQADNRFVSSGLYMTQIRQYLEYFPSESILIVDSDGLRWRRSETMATVFRFLECDPGVVQQGFERMENVGSELTIKPSAYRWLRRRSMLRKWYRSRAEETREALGGRLSRLVGTPIPPPVFDAASREALEAIFRPEVEALRDFSGQDFPGWSI